MLRLPKESIAVRRQFAPVFSDRTWQWAQVLLVGAILAPGQRTVSAILRVMGLSGDAQFQNYHRVLNRATWSSRALSRILLRALVSAFVPAGAPVVLGLDEHIERRRGAKIAAKGIYRDAVRSSKSFFVKTSGLRWVSLMLLAPIPWAQRLWALPFLTVLAPSARYHAERGLRHKTLTDWARQMIRQVRRWLPERALVVVLDSSYAVLELLAEGPRLAPAVTLVTRLRLDAGLYDPAPPRGPHTKGAPRKKGARQPTLGQRVADPTTVWESVTLRWYGGVLRTVELASGTAVWYHPGKPLVPLRWVLLRDRQGEFTPPALLCTDATSLPQQIVEWFVQRWQVEVTYEEARAHLGVETQRQWSDLAIQRTTPALLGLFSLVTLLRINSSRAAPCPPAQRPGTPRHSPPSSIRWPWCVGTSGRPPFLTCHRRTPRWSQFHAPCSIASRTRSPSRRDMDKVEEVKLIARVARRVGRLHGRACPVYAAALAQDS